jgi:hypothetical protein
MATRETRREPRIQPFVAACRIVHEGGRLVGYLTDLSPLGCQVTTQVAPPPPGSLVVLEVRFGRTGTHTALPARIIWGRAGSDGGAHTFGLTFESLSDEQRHALERVVEEFRRLAANLGA